jgi:hypothetical protein
LQRCTDAFTEKFEVEQSFCGHEGLQILAWRQQNATQRFAGSEKLDQSGTLRWSYGRFDGFVDSGFTAAQGKMLQLITVGSMVVNHWS